MTELQFLLYVIHIHKSKRDFGNQTNNPYEKPISDHSKTTKNSF